MEIEYPDFEELTQEEKNEIINRYFVKQLQAKERNKRFYDSHLEEERTRKREEYRAKKAAAGIPVKPYKPRTSSAGSDSS